MRWTAFLAAGILLTFLAPSAPAGMDPDLAERTATFITGIPIIKVWGTDYCIGGGDILPHICCVGVSIPLVMARPVNVPCGA